MFPRKRRVSSSDDVMQALRRGIKSRGEFISCSYFAKPSTLSRVTVIVSKKVSKLAHERNRLKRQARAAAQLSLLPGGDLVIQLFPAAKAEGYETINQQLQRCLHRFF